MDVALSEATEPFSLFNRWYDDAIRGEINDPNAMTLATASPDGVPHARIVLLKGHDSEGFRFFTNRGSHKGEELAANARAALVFHWKSLRRQIRIEGRVTLASDRESDDYFRSRAIGSRWGAWASIQSRPLDARATLEARLEEIKQRFPGPDVPRPPFWGGYCVVPERIEFWHDRTDRLHDRRVFTKTADGWRSEWLYP
jgi:pyridoxamine 5'-phosphate oxidase